MSKNNKHRNRHLIAVTFDIDYKRFKFRENRKSVFNITRERIRKTYSINDDLN